MRAILIAAMLGLQAPLLATNPCQAPIVFCDPTEQDALYMSLPIEPDSWRILQIYEGEDHELLQWIGPDSKGEAGMAESMMVFHLPFSVCGEGKEVPEQMISALRQRLPLVRFCEIYDDGADAILSDAPGTHVVVKALRGTAGWFQVIFARERNEEQQIPLEQWEEAVQLAKLMNSSEKSLYQSQSLWVKP